MASLRRTLADGCTLQQLQQRWPCRADAIRRVWQFLGCCSSDSWPFLYVYGPAGTGKSCIIQDYCSHILCPTARVDCVETNSMRSVLESLLNQLARHVPCEANSYTNYCRCDDMSAFIHHLKKLLMLESRAIIMLDSCERLRHCSSSNKMLDSLIHLSELSQLNISVVFISSLPWDRMMPSISSDFCVPTIFFHPYSESQMRVLLCAALPQHSHLPSAALLVNKLLPQFWPECRVFDRLLPTFSHLYKTLCLPVLDGSIEPSQTSKLFALAKPHFDCAIRSFSGKIPTGTSFPDSSGKYLESYDRDSLPLPRIARLLLLASFFASHNPPRTDSMHFCESTLGRKRCKTSKSQQIKDFEQLQVGPKVFAWERWLAIYYALLKQTSGEQPRICSEEIGQVSVLVSMDLVVSVGNDVRNPRFKCNISLATCEKLAKELKIDFAEHFHGS